MLGNVVSAQTTLQSAEPIDKFVVNYPSCLEYRWNGFPSTNY